jgi:hexokinase
LHSDFKDSATELPYQYGKTSEYDENTYFLPACFISLASSDNTEFSFGGEEDTRSNIRVMVLSFDNYILDSILSLFRDTVREDLTHIPYEDFPYGFSFSIKNFPYNYNNLVSDQSGPVKSFIKEVRASKVVSEQIRENLNKNISIGFLDFELCTYRFPRL